MTFSIAPGTSSSRAAHEGHVGPSELPGGIRGEVGVEVGRGSVKIAAAMSPGLTLLAFRIASRSSLDFERISSFVFEAILNRPATAPHRHQTVLRGENHAVVSQQPL